jgi:hypothetical protein
MCRPVAASRIPAKITATPVVIRQAWLTVARAPIGDSHCSKHPRATVDARMMGGKMMTLG